LAAAATTASAEGLGGLDLRAMTAALDQLDAGGGQRVEHVACPRMREQPVARAPHQHHRAGDRAQVERRGGELGQLRMRELGLAEGGAGERAQQRARHRDRDVEQLADDRVALDDVEPARRLQPGRRHRDDAGEREVGLLREPQRDRAAERVPRDDHRLSPAPLEHERGREVVELGQDRAAREPRRASETGQVDGDPAPPEGRELAQQRPPRVGLLAPPVQEHDPRPEALELEHASAVPGQLHGVLDHGLLHPLHLPRLMNG
jgi:hypothetical protein